MRAGSKQQQDETRHTGERAHSVARSTQTMEEQTFTLHNRQGGTYH